MPGTYQYDVEIKSNVAKLLSDMKQVQDRLDTVEGKEYKIKLNVDEKKLSSVISNLEKMLGSLGKGTGDFKQFENLSKELSSIVSEVQSLSKAFGKVDDSGAKTLLSSIQNIDKSLSDLSQNILNVNKNMSNMGGNTSGAVKQVENISNAYQDAAKEAEKLADAQSKIGQKTNISSGMKDAFPKTSDTASVEKIADGFKEVKQETEKATESAKEYGKILSQVGLVGKKYNEFGEQIPSKYSYTRQTGENQVQTITVKFEKDKESGEIVEREIIGEYVTGFQALEKEIDKADKKVFDLKKNLESNKIKLGDNYDTSALDKLIEDAENDANMLYDALKKVYSEQSEYEYSIAQYDDERAKKQANYNTQLENTKKIEEARVKNASDKKDESFEKKRQDNITQTNRLLNKQQILIDEIEKTYKRTSDNPIDKAVDDTNDLVKLAEKKAAIKEKIDSVYDKGRNSINEETFLEIEQLISEYKQLAAVKLKANNPSKQELGGQKLDVLLSQQVAQYNQLIAKAETYGDATADIVQNLKNQRNAIAEINSDGIYTAKSGLKADDYYSARDNYKKSKAEFTSYEQVAKVNNAISETNSLLKSLKVPNEFKGSFSTLENEVKQLNSEFVSGKISASEYAENIKKAFSDYKTPIDNKSKEIWNELTTSLDRYATLQKRIASNNALSTDVEEAKNLKSHIDKLKESDILPKDKLNLVDEKLQQINQTVTDLKAKLKESTLDSLQGSIDKYQKIYDQRSTYSSDFTPSEQYTRNLSELDTAIKNLVEYKNTLQNVGEVTVEQEAKLKGLVAACEKASDSFKSLSASEKGASQIGIDKLVQRINKDLDENTNYSRQAKQGLRALRDELESANPRNLKEITSEIINIENAEIRAGRAGRSFFDTLKNSGFHQIAAQMAGMFGFYDVINGLKEVASTVIDLNTQITDLAKVSEATSSQIYADFSSYADIAKDIGGTISDTISATADWSRNGYSLPDSKELARVALLYKNVGDGIDIDAANESLISTLRGFKMEADEAEKIIDIFNNVSNNEPIDSGGIGEALQRSAASFNAANTSLQESVALISTTNSVIQNPEKVGNMWKVVSMRIRSATSELEQAGEDTDGLVTSTADLQKMIKAMTGYDILESDGKTFKSIYDIVLNISKVWDNLSDLDQSSLLQALAGKQQSNALAAALSNPELLEKSYQEAMNSAGSAAEEEKKYQQSVQYSIDQTKAKLEELSADLLSSNFLKGAIDAGGKLIDILDGIVKSGNAIPAVATAIAAALSFKNVGIDTLVAY